MVQFEVATCYGSQIFRESAEATIFSEYLKLKEKSGFNNENPLLLGETGFRQI